MGNHYQIIFPYPANCEKNVIKNKKLLRKNSKKGRITNSWALPEKINFYF